MYSLFIKSVDYLKCKNYDNNGIKSIVRTYEFDCTKKKKTRTYEFENRYVKINIQICE
jgi:hypothetical protein